MAAPLRAIPASLGLDVVLLSDDVSLATFGNVLFCHFRGGTPASSVEACREAARDLSGRHGRVVFFGVIEIASATPDDAARRAFTRFFEDAQSHLAAVIVTAYGEGFRGAMVRTVISGIMSIAPSFRLSFPRHVVGTLEQAADLASRVEPTISPGAVLSAFRAFEAMKPAGHR